MTKQRTYDVYYTGKGLSFTDGNYKFTQLKNHQVVLEQHVNYFKGNALFLVSLTGETVDVKNDDSNEPKVNNGFVDIPHDPTEDVDGDEDNNDNDNSDNAEGDADKGDQDGSGDNHVDDTKVTTQSAAPVLENKGKVAKTAKNKK